jgi:hypothetical protein
MIGDIQTDGNKEAKITTAQSSDHRHRFNKQDCYILAEDFIIFFRVFSIFGAVADALLSWVLNYNNKMNFAKAEDVELILKTNK